MGNTTGLKHKDITFNQKSSFEKSEIRQAIARQNFTFQGLPSRHTNNFCKTNANNSNNSKVVKVLSYGQSYQKPVYCVEKLNRHYNINIVEGNGQLTTLYASVIYVYTEIPT